MAHTLPALPYDLYALEPHISRQTLEFHHGKHHNAYVTNLNNLVAGTELEGKSLEDTITAVAGDASKAGVFNNAAQVWNHTFYWNSMSPKKGQAPSGALAEAINKKWGSFDEFKKDFAAKAVGQFGSGWAWLVKTADGGVDIDSFRAALGPTTAGIMITNPSTLGLFEARVGEHGITPERLAAMCADYQSSIGYFRRREFVALFRRQASVAVVWKQSCSKSADEFVAEAVFVPHGNRWLVDHAMVF